MLRDWMGGLIWLQVPMMGVSRAVQRVVSLERTAAQAEVSKLRSQLAQLSEQLKVGQLAPRHCIVGPTTHCIHCRYACPPQLPSKLFQLEKPCH